MLVPEIVSTLRAGYTRTQLVGDVTAGVIVGIVALPLAIAFAIASGVSPERGLWTAIIAGFVISALGGSRVQIGGPTGAFVVIVYDIVQRHGIDGLLVATVMAGALLVVFGLVRLGAVIQFIPHPVVLGFTSGIALIIASGQVRDTLGLRMADVPANFHEKWQAYALHLDTWNPDAVIVSVFALVILLVAPRLNRRIPAPFIALVAATLLVPIAGLDVETLGTRFGAIRANVPAPGLPGVDFETVRALVGPAFTIAMLAAIESLLSAVVADGAIGTRHRSNMELVAQGVANIASPLFGGIPATGAIARTATNIRNGGRTPIAGITHAITLLLVTLFFGSWAGRIPFAALGTILLFVAWHMSEWRTFVAEFRGAPRSDVAVLLSTFALTVIFDLTIAIQVGMVLAAFLFMRRMAEVTNVSVITRELAEEGEREPDAVPRDHIPHGVEIYDINGPFFFGAAEKFKSRVGSITKKPRVLILRLRGVPAIDSTGLHALKDFVRRSRHDGQVVLLSDVDAQPLAALRRSGLLDELGPENLFGALADALVRATSIVTSA